jgi:hypothetical protein
MAKKRETRKKVKTLAAKKLRPAEGKKVKGGSTIMGGMVAGATKGAGSSGGGVGKIEHDPFQIQKTSD